MVVGHLVPWLYVDNYIVNVLSANHDYAATAAPANAFLRSSSEES